METWETPHDLQWINQSARRPADGWWENRTTGLIHILCNCGYSSGWISRDQAPDHADLTRQHSNPQRTPYGPRTAVADWLTANGIDPADVPLNGPVAIEPDPATGGRRIRYTALLRTEDGHHYRDPATGDVARGERTTPLTIEPPANVQVTALP